MPSYANERDLPALLAGTNPSEGYSSPETHDGLLYAIQHSRHDYERQVLQQEFARRFGPDGNTPQPAPYGLPTPPAATPAAASPAAFAPAALAAPQQPTTINSLDDLRSWYGDAGKNLSDEALMRGFARAAGVHPAVVANQFGYDPGSGSQTGERFSSAGDRYMGSMKNLGSTVARAVGANGIADSLQQGADNSDFAADVHDYRASQLGAVSSWKDVHGPSDLLNYAGGLAIQSAPAMAEMAGGAVAGSMLAGPVGAAGGLVEGGMAGLRGLRAAAAAGDAVAAARLANIAKVGSVAGSAVADYPTAVGDILSTQRQQNGQQDLGSAMLGAIPRTALDVGLGSGRMVATGSLPRTAFAALDDMTGISGAIARGGANAARIGAEQAIDSVGREAINQYSGRMAVDPNETFINDQSVDRFKEAGIGGSILGAALGGGLGGWRRGGLAGHGGTVDDNPDLLSRGTPDQSKPLMLGYDPAVGSAINGRSDQTPVPVTREGQAIPADSVEAHSDYQMSQRAPGGLRTPGPDTTLASIDLNNALPSIPPPAARVEQTPGFVGFGHESSENAPNPLDTSSFKPASPMPAPPDAAQALAQAHLSHWQEQQQAIENAAKVAAQRQQLAEEVIGGPRNPDGTLVKKLPQRVVDTFHALVAAKDGGAVTPQEFVEQAGYLKAGVPGDVQKVRKFVEEKVNAQPDVPKAPGVAEPTPAGRGDNAGGSSGNVGRVAPDAVGRGVDAATPPGVGGGTPNPVGLDAQPGTPAPVVPPATEPAPATKPKFQKAPRPDAKPEIKPRTESAPAPVGPPKFDNIPDLADAVAKENGMTPEHAKAYVDNVVMGRSLSKIGDDLGKPKSTVGDMVKQMKAVMDPAKHFRLEAAADDGSVHADPELAAHTEAVVPHGEEHIEQPEETGELAGTDDMSRHGDEAIRVDDEGQVDVSGDPKQTGMSVREGMDAGGETKAKSDDEATRAYKKALGGKSDDKALGEQWAELNKELPKRDQVKWDDLSPGHKLWFKEEVARGNAKEGHESVTAIANDPDMRLSRMSHKQFLINGADGTIHGNDKPSSMADMRAVGQAEQRFPQLASKVAGVSQGYRYGPASPVGKSILASAMDNVQRSALGPFFKVASGLVKHVVDLKDAPSEWTGAAYLPGSGMVAVRLGALPLVDARSPNLVAAQHITHEFVHAADDLVGRQLGDGPELSLHEGSPTLARMDYDLANGTKGKLTLGPVVEEALRAYQADPAKWADLDQALGMLDRLDKAVDRRNGDLSGVKLKQLDDIAETASVELTPKLMEMLLTAPDTLRELPLSKAHAEALANAESPADIAKVLGGIDDATGTDGRPDGKGVAAVQPVRGQVQDAAASGSRPVGGPDVGADRQQPQGREAAPRLTDQAGRVQNPRELDPPLLSDKGGLASWIKGITGDKLYRTMPSVLGFLTTEQIGQQFPEVKPAAKFSNTMERMGAASSQMAEKGAQVMRAWQKAISSLGDGERAKFDRLVNEATRTQVWPDRPLDHPTQAHLDASDPKVIAAHKALSEQWAATPKAYKDIFAATQKHAQEMFDRNVAAIRKGSIEANYPPEGASAAVPTKALIDQAAALPKGERQAFLDEHATSKVASDTYRSLFDSLDAQEKVSQLQGPYAPQSRFGDHIVHYKAPEYLAAEKALADATAEVQRLHESDNYKPLGDLDASIAADTAKLKRSSNPERVAQLQQDLKDAKAEREKLAAPLDAAKKLVDERTEALNALKADRNAYNVEFFENRNQAVTREKQLKAFFGDDGTQVVRTLRDQYLKQSDNITPAYVKKIEEHLTASLSGQDAQEVRRTVREMYLQNLPGTSALKSQLKRRNVPGIKDEDALRSFSNKSMRDAYAISRLEHGGELQQHLRDLRASDDEDHKIIGNELAKRIEQNFSVKTNRAISLATNATYLTSLGLSPSFMLMQGTQQWMNTAPIMAARHGMSTFTRLNKSTADAAKLLKVSFSDAKDKMNFGVDIKAGVKAGLIDEHEGAMLQDMFDRGRIDITTAHDLGIAASGGEPGVLARAAAMSNWPVKQVETINRISTALAAFRAEHEARIKGGAEIADARRDAAKYADTLVSETHMNYAGTNRARFFHANNWGGWGRVMFQFRGYQQGMAYLTIKNLVSGLRGDKEAMRAVGYLAGTQLAVAGTAGLPVPGAMAIAAHLMYRAWNEKDEDKDLKEMFYQGLKSVGGETFARGITSGVPGALGVNLSERLGMGHTFDIAPFVRDQKDGRDLTAAYWMSLTGGAAGGLLANYAEAVHQATDGNFAKAATFALPKVAADLIRAGTLQTKGITDSRGNQVLTPEEISAAAAAMRAFGLQSEDVQRTYDQRTSFFESRQARNDVRAKLLTDFANAQLQGGDTSAIREKVAGFNERHPDDRIAPGQLTVAVQKRREAIRNMRSGVPVGKRDKALADDLGVE